MRRLLAIGALVLLTAGCSEIAAIAPVGGNRVSEVRYAALDILVQQEVAILTAPVCAEANDKTVSCEGETVDGDKIVVTSAGDDQANFTITVGSTTVFEGAVQDVLDDAIRPAS